MLNQIVADSGTGTESCSVRFGITALQAALDAKGEKVRPMAPTCQKSWLWTSRACAKSSTDPGQRMARRSAKLSGAGRRQPSKAALSQLERLEGRNLSGFSVTQTPIKPTFSYNILIRDCRVDRHLCHASLKACVARPDSAALVRPHCPKHLVPEWNEAREYLSVLPEISVGRKFSCAHYRV